jgi:hypothetical protein
LFNSLRILEDGFDLAFADCSLESIVIAFILVRIGGAEVCHGFIEDVVLTHVAAEQDGGSGSGV